MTTNRQLDKLDPNHRFETLPAGGIRADVSVRRQLTAPATSRVNAAKSGTIERSPRTETTNWNIDSGTGSCEVGQTVRSGATAILDWP